MVLPTSSALEQFLEMTKALKRVEDKYKKPQYHPQNRHDQSTGGNSSNKENQQPKDSMQLTSHPSQNQITTNTQIGNVTVGQIATLGSNPDHVVEALEDVLASQTMEE